MGARVALALAVDFNALTLFFIVAGVQMLFLAMVSGK